MVFLTLTKSEKGVAKFSFPTPLMCNKNAKVGLSEILIPNCLPQIRGGDTPYIQIHKYTRKSHRQRNYRFIETYDIVTNKDLFFENIEQLLTYINAQINFSGIQLAYLEQYRRINIRFRVLRNKRYHISLSSQINELLGGLSDSPKDIFYTNRISSTQPDIHSSKYNLFVYFPAIKPSYVGDISSPLMRLISINTRSTYTHHIFKVPFYHSLIPGALYEIYLYITDQHGEYLNFPTNKYTRITLHFVGVE